MPPAEAEAHGEMEHHLSPWPLLLSAGFGVVIFSLAAFGTVILHPVFLLGLGIFGAGVGGWVYDDFVGRRVPHVPGARVGEEGTLEGFSPRKAAMWAFLVSEIMFFSGLIVGSWAVRAAAEEWVAPGVVLDIPITALNTFILISSSFVMAEALRAAQLGDQKALVKRLSLVLLLGLTFVSIQGFEYFELVHKGLTPWASPVGPAAFGSTFFLQTGFHGAHVSGGLVALAYVALKARTGAYTGENHETVELMGLYWHYVDVVWIFLFPIVYLL